MEILKAILFGIVEGITEWLPISSTGHMILLDEFVKLNVSAEFKDIFLIVIQLGAIMAVVTTFWRRLMPIVRHESKLTIDKNIIRLWLKIIVACLPAAIVGLLWDKQIEKTFYNYQTVSLALIVFGLAFIVVEYLHKDKKPTVNSVSDISFRLAVVIGLFQLLAAIFPGTSRSGATIIGALLFGLSRLAAAEFTFFLAVPVMLGASLLKLAKSSLSFSSTEWATLLVGMAVAYMVSAISIKFLVGYVKKHSFTPFGWYRIALGLMVISYFAFFK